MYRSFEKVVKLTVNQRVQGTDQQQVLFRDLLSQLRTGESSEADWKLLLSRQPSEISDLSEFDDAIRLFYGTKEVANFNSEQLDKLGQPVAQINACHTSAAAKKLNSNDMSGLEPVIFLAKGTKVMLTS